MLGKPKRTSSHHVPQFGDKIVETAEKSMWSLWKAILRLPRIPQMKV